MSEPSRGFKWASVLWALLIGAGIIALAGSVLLPSTKRARVDWDEVRRMQAEEEAEAAAPATQSTTDPSTAPTTAPAPE
jgi:hypothetical protein